MCVCVNGTPGKSFDCYILRYSGALHLQAIVVDEDFGEAPSLFEVANRCLFLIFYIFWGKIYAMLFFCPTKNK